MLNDRIKDINLEIFNIVDRAWRNSDQVNAAIEGSCSPQACLIKKDYLGVITVTEKQFQSIMLEKFVIPSEYTSILISKYNFNMAKANYFNGEIPKYYILYNKLASKGYLHVSEIGYAPIIIPNKNPTSAPAY